jgi:hypothetical protein
MGGVLRTHGEIINVYKNVFGKSERMIRLKDGSKLEIIKRVVGCGLDSSG